MAQILDAAIAGYVDSLVPSRHPELQAMEEYARQHDFPIIGPACGHLCYQVARMIGARRVFELGSGYGYSTAFFARAVQENGGGVVHHVVWDEELSGRARRHLAALGLDGVVQFHVAEAVGELERTEGPFDLIFNDIDKKGYPASLPAIEKKLRPGGVLIVDNMLWSGRVLDHSDRSPETEGIRALTRALLTDRWITSVVPIRDGLLVSQRP
ncbi:MAG TPA: O-methyltransferase [Vicinamibacterales bacterium]|nr:O-methyltransferase [Vicinamibacterales bacterium]